MEKCFDQGLSFPECKDERLEASGGENNSDAGILHGYYSVPCYSEQEAKALAEKLVNKETFRKAQQVLITWLNTGQCNEQNAVNFYSLIQLCWNRMEKLKFKQKQYFKEDEKAQEDLNKNYDIYLQLNEIERVFKMIEDRNILSYFTQDQIKNIQKMGADVLNFEKDILKDSVGIESEEESSGLKQVNNENVESGNIAPKVQAKSVEMYIDNQKFEDSKTRCQGCQNEILKLNLELENGRKLQRKSNSILVDDKQQKNNSDVASQCNLDEVYENEMHIVSLASVILSEYPDGASIDCIYSHLKNSSIITCNCARDIEEVMRKYPAVFKEISPIGDTLEKKWMNTINVEELLKEPEK